MKTLAKEIRTGCIIGISFLLTVIGGGILYAAIGSVWTNPSSLETSAGAGLTSAAWNGLLANFSNLDSRVNTIETNVTGMVNVPPGTIIAYSGTICPATWSEYTLARGQFLRGLDPTASNDPDGATRTMGSIQSDALQGHKHALGGLKNTVLGAGSSHWNSAPGYTDTWSSQLIGSPITDGTNGTPRTASETRPKNVAVLFCIKN